MPWHDVRSGLFGGEGNRRCWEMIDSCVSSTFSELFSLHGHFIIILLLPLCSPAWHCAFVYEMKIRMTGLLIIRRVPSQHYFSFWFYSQSGPQFGHILHVHVRPLFLSLMTLVWSYKNVALIRIINCKFLRAEICIWFYTESVSCFRKFTTHLLENLWPW